MQVNRKRTTGSRKFTPHLADFCQDRVAMFTKPWERTLLIGPFLMFSKPEVPEEMARKSFKTCGILNALTCNDLSTLMKCWNKDRN